jgi:DNA-binding NarL/FixJ family response regulator
MVLDGLSRALGVGHQIVATLKTAAGVLEACRNLKPDVVLLDHSLPDRPGLELIRELAFLSGPRILFVTMHNERKLADVAMQAGAHGFVPKSAPVAELSHAIREVLAGRRYVSPAVQEAPSHTTEEVAFGLARLSPRRRQILRMVAQGMSTQQIANEIGLTPAGVTFHRAQIRKELGLEDEFSLLRYALLAAGPTL